MNRRKFWARQNRTKLERLILKRKLINLLGGKCVDCGYSEHLAALDFDHTDPSKKTNTVSRMLVNNKEVEIIEEAMKCEIRCANCHRIKTHPTATL